MFLLKVHAEDETFLWMSARHRRNSGAIFHQSHNSTTDHRSQSEQVNNVILTVADRASYDSIYGD